MKMKLAALIVSSMNISAIHFLELPHEVQHLIVSLVGYKQTLQESVRTLCRLRCVCKELHEVASGSLLFEHLVQESIIESPIPAIALRKGIPDEDGSMLFFVGWDEQEGYLWARLLPSVDEHYVYVPEQPLAFIHSPYTAHEVQAIKHYLMWSVKQDDPEDQSYRQLVIRCAHSKGQLLDHIIVEMIRWYKLKPLSHDMHNHLSSYSSLVGRNPTPDLITKRLERFKMLVPFLHEMYTFRFVMNNVPDLIRMQLQDFEELVIDKDVRIELSELCEQLSQVALFEDERRLLREQAVQLFEPVTKRIRS